MHTTYQLDDLVEVLEEGSGGISVSLDEARSIAKQLGANINPTGMALLELLDAVNNVILSNHVATRLKVEMTHREGEFFAVHIRRCFGEAHDRPLSDGSRKIIEQAASASGTSVTADFDYKEGRPGSVWETIGIIWE